MGLLILKNDDVTWKQRISYEWLKEIVCSLLNRFRYTFYWHIPRVLAALIEQYRERKKQPLKTSLWTVSLVGSAKNERGVTWSIRWERCVTSQKRPRKRISIEGDGYEARLRSLLHVLPPSLRKIRNSFYFWPGNWQIVRFRLANSCIMSDCARSWILQCKSRYLGLLLWRSSGSKTIHLYYHYTDWIFNTPITRQKAIITMYTDS